MPRARSGRQVGRTCTRKRGSAAMAMWCSRRSAGSSVVHTTWTRKRASRPRALPAGLGEERVALLPDAGGGLRAEQAVDAEGHLQLKVCPVVERVAQALRHRRRPGQELVAIVGRTGDQALVDAVGAHRPPLVMVAGEPQLGEVGEAPVAGDVRRREVVVVVDDRLRRRVAVVELPRAGAVQQEVLGDERRG